MNSIECKHGKLARSCEICELEEELADWKKDCLTARGELRNVMREHDDALAENKRLRDALETCRFSIKNENHVSGDVAASWIKYIDIALSTESKETGEG